jgi:23S rRNA (pseudouridine1915-N3)-methyltransferase
VKLTLIAVGKLRDAWAAEGCAEFEKRVRGKLPLEIRELKERDDILAKVPPRHALWALDVQGKQLSSEELAAQLGGMMRSGAQGVAFAIGGADGLKPEVLQRADFKLSLGRMTLPHRLARLILLEQLYRALSIVRGEPYHRG